MDPQKALAELRAAGAIEVQTWSRRRFGFVLERDGVLTWLGENAEFAVRQLRALGEPVRDDFPERPRPKPERFGYQGHLSRQRRDPEDDMLAVAQREQAAAGPRR